jgi:poly-gamma-glutamate synthesis protein (capsule biosynthesis protein)
MNYPKKYKMKLLITGDFCPIRRYTSQMTKPPREVLGDLYNTIKEADFTFTNLECPITNFPTPINKTGPAIKAELKALDFLNNTGIRYVTLANNHILDYGNEGLKDTIKALKAKNINYLGAGSNFNEASKPMIIEKNGLKTAILNFAENEWSTTFSNTPGASPINPVRNYKSIQSAKKIADKVIIISHGGHEMFKYPSPRMKELFRFYVDAGADAVLNHHTHCISGYEIYNKAPIFYSLGNFLFDNNTLRNNIWNEGMAVDLKISKENVSFKIIHFNQANENPVLEVCNEEETRDRVNKLDKINSVIQDDSKLSNEFNLWVQSQKKMFNAFIEPRSSRFSMALQSRKLLPSLWSTRKKMFLLNLIKCEAHQDILVSILKDDVSNT